MPQFQESILIPLLGCVKTFLTGDAKEMETTSFPRRNVSKHAEVFLNTKLCIDSVHSTFLADYCFHTSFQ